MTLLVTGSAGFIGLALSIRLLDCGDTVVGIDNHNDYYDPKLISFYDSYIWSHHTQALFAYLTAIFYRSYMDELRKYFTNDKF